jgi:tetratricopeptide (TPR) repeat protein
MRANLVEALRDEAILLVLDNFETNLERVETAVGSSVYACADPAWDALLTTLARDLPATPRSRLLVTTRHRPRALADAATTLWIPLGPLPMGEAALYLRTRPELRRLLLGADPSGKALVYRLLQISRGHPLILDRLARLAADPAALSAALDRVQAEGWRELPDLFAGEALDDATRKRERRYLEDVAIGSVDLLIERLSPDACRLLRMVTLANEPVSERFIEGVWQGKSADDEKLEELGAMIELIERLPDDHPQKQQLAAVLKTDAGKQALERLRNPSPPSDAPPVGPLLAELYGAGLVTRDEPTQPDAEEAAVPAELRHVLDVLAGGQATYGFHDLVRERIGAWTADHAAPDETWTDDAIRIAYGARYVQLFRDIYHRNRDAAGEAGRRALVYFVTARAFERLGAFVGRLVTGVTDPTMLRSVVAELQSAIEQAPSGETRWRLRIYVADALRLSGQPDQALPFYAMAARDAETAGDWADVAWITGNWASACMDTGDLEESKRLNLRSAEIERRAGRPEANILGRELEALRIDVMRGEAEQTLPAVESRLDRVRQWWQRHQAGTSVAEAPDRTVLGRLLVSGLEIAGQANLRLGHWKACLGLLKETESVKQALSENDVELAMTRFSQYGPLLRLGRPDEAQGVLESCLPVYRSAGMAAQEAHCLAALASVWYARNDLTQAIALERQTLEVRSTLPNPSDRALSHDNLSTSFAEAGRHAEAAAHRLAAGVYDLIMQADLTTWLYNLGIDARQALAEGQRYTLPRLEEVIAQPEFTALRQFLDRRGIDRTALQAEIDRLVDQAH